PSAPPRAPRPTVSRGASRGAAVRPGCERVGGPTLGRPTSSRSPPIARRPCRAESTRPSFSATETTTSRQRRSHPARRVARPWSRFAIETSATTTSASTGRTWSVTAWASRGSGAGGASPPARSRTRTRRGHRLKHAVSEDDEVVALAGDAEATLFVLTRETSEPCAGGDSGALGVRVLRVDRKTGSETAVSLAQADCASVPGPFWIGAPGATPAASVVAWAHRKAKRPATAAPIDGLVYRVLASDRSTPLTMATIDVQAEALVDAGCDDTGCFAAALVRGADAD